MGSKNVDVWQTFDQIARMVAEARRLERLSWPPPSDAMGTLRHFVSHPVGVPSWSIVRAAMTFANEAGDWRLVAEAAVRIGEQPIFDDVYVYGQVAIARKALGLVDWSAWQDFVVRTRARQNA